uniref:Uncharacterized protein n=1 Tax=Wuchereria bancrofti TaxID=6293 RepID=A0AAF5PII1_WUCBA
MMPPDGGATGRTLGRLIGRVNRLVVQSLTIVIIVIVLLSLTVDVVVLTRLLPKKGCSRVQKEAIDLIIPHLSAGKPDIPRSGIHPSTTCKTG